MTDHDEPAAPHLASRPSGVELLPESLPDALNEQPHRLSGDLDEALHPQHSELFSDGGEAREQAGRIGCRGDVNDEAFEVVVIVAVFGVVVGWALGEIILDRGGYSEQNGGIDASLTGFDQLDRTRDLRLDFRGHT